MRRVVVIAVTFLVTVALLAAVAVLGWGDAARAEGERLYFHRKLLWVVDSLPTDKPTAVWFGDSTIIGDDPYPVVIARRTPALLHYSLSMPGLDPLAYYSLMNSVVTKKPKVMILVAHWRVFAANGGRNTTDLTSQLSWAEMPRAMLLPFHTKGTTAPRMVLAHLLRSTKAERWLYVLEGGRRLFATAGFWEPLGRIEAGKGRAFWEYTSAQIAQWEAYNARITPWSAGVQMLAGAVRVGAEAGIPVLVVVSPIPWEGMAERGLYDPAVFAHRIDGFRRVIADAGGLLVDLHHAMTKAEFDDVSGHLNATGRERMADLLTAPILAAADGHLDAAARAVVEPH